MKLKNRDHQLMSRVIQQNKDVGGSGTDKGVFR